MIVVWLWLAVSAGFLIGAWWTGRSDFVEVQEAVRDALEDARAAARWN